MSSRQIFEFKCEDGHIKELYVYAEDREATCSCGKPSKRIISAVRCKLDPLSGDFPGATMKWIKDREKASKPNDS